MARTKKTAAAIADFIAAPSAKGAAARQEFNGVHDIACLDTQIAFLTALRDQKAVELTNAVHERLHRERVEDGVVPAKTVEIRDGDAVAKVKIARKTVKQPLSENAVKELTKLKIVPDAVTTEYALGFKAGDQAMLKKLHDFLAIPAVAKALEKADLVDAFVVLDPKTDYVVTDDVLESAMGIADFQTMMAIFPSVATLSIGDAAIVGDKPLEQAMRRSAEIAKDAIAATKAAKADTVSADVVPIKGRRRAA